MFAYWESGKRAIMLPAYREAMTVVYDASPEELGFTDPYGDSQSVDLERVEAVRRDLDDLLSAGPGDARLEDWEQLVARHGRATRDRPAGPLLDDLVADVAELKRAISRSHASAALRRLKVLVAQMSGLIVLTLIKLDERARFRQWAGTARLAAAEAGDPATIAWVLAHEAHGHYYGDNLPEAIAIAEAAQEAAGRNTCTGAPLAAALQARASAAIGLPEDTQAAIGRAEEATARLAHDQSEPSAFGYNQAQLRFHTSNAYTHLGNTRAAFAAQDRALALCAPGDYTDWAMIRLDRALCHVTEHDATQAASEAAETLTSLTLEQRHGIIDLRARAVLAAIPRRQRSTSPVRDLRELLILKEDNYS
jgi:hypothetical protein